MNHLIVNGNTNTSGNISTTGNVTMTNSSSKLSVAGNIENVNYTFTNTSATLYGSQIDTTKVLLPTQKLIFGEQADSGARAIINYDSTQGILEIIC